MIGGSDEWTQSTNSKFTRQTRLPSAKHSKVSEVFAMHLMYINAQLCWCAKIKNPESCPYSSVSFADLSLENADNQLAEHLQAKNGHDGRYIYIAYRRNNPPEGRNHRADDFVQGSPRLVVPVDIWKPTKEAPDDQEYIEEL